MTGVAQASERHEGMDGNCGKPSEDEPIAANHRQIAAVTEAEEHERRQMVEDDPNRYLLVNRQVRQRALRAELERARGEDAERVALFEIHLIRVGVPENGRDQHHGSDQPARRLQRVSLTVAPEEEVPHDESKVKAGNL